MAEILPQDINELRRREIDWKAVTNSFDYETVDAVIRLWEKYEDRRTVARMIATQMSVDNIRDISSREIQPVVDLVTMYKYKEDSKKYRLLGQLARERHEALEREKMKRMIRENTHLKEQVERLKAQLKETKDLVKTRDEEVDEWKKRYEKDENKIVALAADNAKKDKEIRVLRQHDLERHKKMPTADDFVKRLVKEVKKQFKHDNNKIEVLRQILYNLGCTEAEAELDAWIEGREYKPSMKVEGDVHVHGNLNDVHDNKSVNL